MKNTEYLKNKKGSAYINAVVIILLAFILINFLIQFYIITINTSKIKKAIDSAVISVSLDNYEKTFSSQREGYTGAYIKDGASWKVDVSTGDVYAKLTDNLSLKKEGSTYTKYNGENVAFSISGLNVNATAAAFKTSGDTTSKFTANTTVDLSIPVYFMGKQIDTINTTVECVSEYSYKF